MVDDIKILKELSLAEQLRRVARLWRNVADKELAPLGLTHPRWTALWKLQNLNDNVSQKALAKALEIELASLMRTLSQLEDQNLIVRYSSETDKRVRIVSLTDEGKAMITKVEARILQIRRDLMTGISEEELNQFKRTVELIAQNALAQLNESEQD
ncbi:transcriptional regulator, MarR family [Shewanella sediminis HAW-EB3]|uniref:Transcriptional regulator, MarR family n=1 Tax=Shewanella sediminis (strain HAW-EB3) TaxID=425104 RepID=A8FUK9_SHESH|nr:MarR family transcriptional regulator [Shewanella sediminis]ABV36532.1 transcriptional regulator, MarR family [Shewanella sediminis HAW-EB3]